MAAPDEEWPEREGEGRAEAAPGGVRGPARLAVRLRQDAAGTAWASNLELAYAITVHKSQGSQFRHVFFVVPQAAADVFGRELTYTGLTRAQETLTLFVEKDLGAAARPAQARGRANAAAQLAALRGHARRRRRLPRLWAGPCDLARRTRAQQVRGDHRQPAPPVRSEERLTYEYEEELAAPGSNGRDLRLARLHRPRRGRDLLLGALRHGRRPRLPRAVGEVRRRGTSATASTTG